VKFYNLNMSQERNEKPVEEIQVEDLLRLKRHEKPDDAFWGKFDRELHQQMLRTLVKKDPWYIQISRGFSGHFAQSIGVVAAAIALAVVGVRSTFHSGGEGASTVVAEEPSGLTPIQFRVAEYPSEITMVELSYTETLSSAKAHDYSIGEISSEPSSNVEDFEKDFSMDSFQVASYDQVTYSAETVGSAFGATGVASLVY